MQIDILFFVNCFIDFVMENSKGKTVCENLKISPAMLSRFDLIFILLDKPDHQKDEMLSEHVMAVCSFHLDFSYFIINKLLELTVIKVTRGG